MAPKKRASRTVKETNNNDYKNLKLDNVLCPICRNIFIEPVTLPCNHGFCLACFEGTVSNANLTCPLCRVRFGSWHRIAKKENKIVNVPLWNAVRQSFPQQVKNRLEGVEENLDEDPELVIRVASPGAIRREYEIQREKEEKQKQKEREAEEKASNHLIKQLQEQEEFEETVREEKLRLDEKVAQQLAEEYGVIRKPGLESNSNNKSVARKRNTLDKYLVSMPDSVQKWKLNNAKAESQSSSSSKNMKASSCSSKGNCQEKQVPRGIEKIFEKAVVNSNNVQKKVEVKACEKPTSENEIDSECKFFKPIEPAKSNLKASTPAKVPVRSKKLSSVVIRSPKGKKDFKHKSFSSPFVYFKPPRAFEYIDIPFQKLMSSQKQTYPTTKKSDNSVTISKIINSSAPICKPKVSRIKINNILVPSLLPQVKPNALKQSIKNNCNHNKELESVSSRSNKPSCSTHNESSLDGSPFYGFPSSNAEEEYLERKKIQEKQDMEYAMKLHQELNLNGRSNSIRYNNSRKRKRQATLDELVDPIKAAK